MNTYRCWYQGIKGYSCRIRDKRWMFVPDIDQPDNRTQRNLDLVDLEFANKHEKRFELGYEASMTKSRTFIRFFTGRNKQPETIYGQLLLPG